jgi:colanic acid biosynthesis glycosyl transferase WcaI
VSKILIHTIVFSPDGVSTAYIYNDIALRLQEGGHEVIVLTTTPHFNVLPDSIKKQPLKAKIGGLWYESDYNGIKVIHIPQKKYKSTLLRLIGFIYWHLFSFVVALFIRKLDVIMSPSPPLTLGVENIILGKIKRAKVIYNVQEIYPDLLIADGDLRSSLLIGFLRKMERFVYRYSDAVTTIDHVFYTTLLGRFYDPSRLSIIPNFVDTGLYTECKSDPSQQLDPEVFPATDELKLMYAGNIGNAQDWSTFTDLARALLPYPVRFYVVGEGVDKETVKKTLVSEQLVNVTLVSYQPRESMPALIAYADLHFIFMAPRVEGHGFPSKVYTLMACSKPMLVCSGKTTPIVNFLHDKGCAMIVSEDDSDRKLDEIKKLILGCTKQKLVEMGRNGRIHVEEHYSKEKVTHRYLELVEQLTS